MLPLLGLPLSIWIFGQLAVRMEPFMNNFSMSEAMGDLYGKTVQIISGITALIARTGYVAIQLKVMGIMLASLLHLDSGVLTIVSAIIVLVYTTFGGIRSVTFTDIIQFLAFGIIIPILALAIWNGIQDPTQVARTLVSNPNFDFKTVVGWTPRFMSTVGLMLVWLIPGYFPEMFQWVVMAKDVHQAKHAFTYAAGIFLLMFLLQGWIGILLLADNPGIAPNQVVPYLIKHHVHTGLRGLLGVGILALAMSKAASVLNACSVVFANDVVKPLLGRTRGRSSPPGYLPCFWA